MNSSTAATLPLAHTSSKYRRTRASFSCADTNALLVKPLSPSGCRLLSIGEHDATLRDALHRLETYSPSCLEGEFCELRLNGLLRSSLFLSTLPCSGPLARRECRSG